MKREFWLLDLNYEAKEGKPSIWIWGITRDDKRVLLIHEYEPYFYVLPNPLQDPTELKRRLEAEIPHPAISRVDVETKMLLQKQATVLKVFCKTTDSLEKLARQTVKALGADASFEEDLRPATKYQNDNGIKPCQWYEAQGEPSGLDVSRLAVDEVLECPAPPVSVIRDETPPLRAFAFSVLAVSQMGSPHPERDPVGIIAWFGTREAGHSESQHSDGETIQDFAKKIHQVNPDLIFSFGGNRFSWPYLIRRAEKNKERLSVGREGGSPHQSLYGHFSVTGRVNVDLSDFAQDLYDVKEKTLEEVARFIGIKFEEIVRINETDYYDYWSDRQRRNMLTKRVENEARIILELGTDALSYVSQLSSLTGLPADHVLTAAVGFRVDNYMMMEAHKLGQLIPPRNEQPIIPYRGAIVLQPELGIHENVAVLDFSSMYPSLMIKYNISPDTYIETGPEGDSYTIPEVRTQFRKSPAGLFTTVLSNLIQTRRQVKQELANLQKGTPKYRVLKARERATKIITNAVYGYAGWAGARWYARQVAESAAALGRDTIKKSISIANSLGLKVLYGDTDSLFVAYEEKLVDEFLKIVERELGLEISLSHLYKRILFTGAMKKYAGLEETGELDIVGMEAIRGDWSPLARDVQNRILQMVLEDNRPSRALAFVEGLVRDLKSANLPMSSFVIWKTLTKRPDQYDVRAPHVEAAKRLVKDGWKVSAGDRVGYVIVKGPGKLFQKAEPYFKVSREDVDYEYYIHNQVLPLATRTLSVFGVSESDLARERGVQNQLRAGPE